VGVSETAGQSESVDGERDRTRRRGSTADEGRRGPIPAPDPSPKKSPTGDRSRDSAEHQAEHPAEHPAESGAGDQSPSAAAAGARSDDELLRAWRTGDRAALEQLLRGYQPRIYAVCYRMLQSADQAADLTQDALTKVLEGLHSYDGRSQLSTWVIRVTMNCCLSYLRKLRLRRHGSIDEPTAAGDRSMIREQVAGERVEQVERQEAVSRALARVEPEMRSIIVLRDIQGLDYQQIGEVLSVPVGTVKSRLFRARSALRELVDEELPPPAEPSR